MKRLRKQEYLKGYPLAVNRQPEVLPIELHSHEFSELVVVFSGKATHFNSHEAYEISAGDCYMAVGLHGYKNVRHLSLVNILFIPGKLNIPWTEAQKLPGFHAFFSLEPRFRKKHHFKSKLTLTTQELAKAAKLITETNRLLKLKEPGCEFYATMRFMELITFITETYVKREDSKHTSLTNLSDIIAYLDRKFTEPINLEVLAKKACMSVSCLLRSFKKATGNSPIDYLIQKRIHHSSILLREGRHTVTEIAEKSGFQDSNYFTRQFKKIMKTSPRHYLKAYKL